MPDRPPYRDLLLTLENDLKRQANLQDWSPEKRRQVQEQIEKLRALLDRPGGQPDHRFTKSHSA